MQISYIYTFFFFHLNEFHFDSFKQSIWKRTDFYARGYCLQNNSNNDSDFKSCMKMYACIKTHERNSFSGTAQTKEKY